MGGTRGPDVGALFSNMEHSLVAVSPRETRLRNCQRILILQDALYERSSSQATATAATTRRNNRE